MSYGSTVSKQRHWIGAAWSWCYSVWMSLEGCCSTFRGNSHCFQCWLLQIHLSGAQAPEPCLTILFSPFHTRSFFHNIPILVPDTCSGMAHITDSFDSNYCFPFRLLTLLLAQQFFKLVTLALRFKMCWLFFIAILAIPIYLLVSSALFGAFESTWGNMLRILAGWFPVGFHDGKHLPAPSPHPPGVHAEPLAFAAPLLTTASVGGIFTSPLLNGI